MNQEQHQKKLIVGITGASGVDLGIKFLKLLPKDIKVYAVLSNSAKKTLEKENSAAIIQADHIEYYQDSDLAAPISSGSFQTDAFIIIPCSMNTLAKCACGLSDTLITRVFSVMLKERRDIVIAPREMPFNSIQLENMSKLANLGVSIAPPVLGYYSGQQTLEDMENFIIGKWFDLLKIPHKLFKRWGE
jgi:flavin prenyltransferase